MWKISNVNVTGSEMMSVFQICFTYTTPGIDITQQLLYSGTAISYYTTTGIDITQ